MLDFRFVVIIILNMIKEWALIGKGGNMLCCKTKKLIVEICRLSPIEKDEPETENNCPHVIFDCHQKPSTKASIEKLRLEALALLPKYFNCALIASTHGGMTLEEVGSLMGITRERVRQIERSALERIAYGKKLTKTDLELLNDGFMPKKQGKRYRMMKEVV